MNKLKTIWPYITIIFAAVAWVLVNSNQVVDNYNSFLKWYGTSPALEGRWNNSSEGDLDPPTWLTSQKDFVETRITIDKSQLDGSITSGALKKVIPFDYVLLTGKKRAFRNTIDAEAFDYIEGKRVSFGYYTISLSDDVLTVIANNDGNPFFPRESKLIKRSNIAFPPIDKESLDKKDSEDNK